MEIFESIEWMTLDFIPRLGAMEIAIPQSFQKD
jgi:hypothetical protein